MDDEQPSLLERVMAALLLLCMAAAAVLVLHLGAI